MFENNPDELPPTMDIVFMMEQIGWEEFLLTQKVVQVD